MHVRRLTPIAPLALLVSALIAPNTAYAYETQNLAGRPISGIADNTGMSIHETACQGLAYAAVNNKMALLTAGHCMGPTHSDRLELVGVTVQGPNGGTIGEWGPLVENIDNHDLAYIKLYSGNWPSNRNRVYRGDVIGDDWWTITAMPSGAIKCSELEDNFGDDISRTGSGTTLQTTTFERV